MRFVPFRFRNARKLARHFSDHRADFGATTEAEYEQMADEFLSNPLTADCYERIRAADNDTIRFTVITDEYAVLSYDGFIRTYFKPDPLEHGLPTNYDYYLRD